jgi:ABC-type transporter MlaC component
MKMKYILAVLLFAVALSGFGQVVVSSVQQNELEFTEQDTLIDDTVLLEEVIVDKRKLSLEERKAFLILQNRVFKVYPYAKVASEKLITMNANIDKLTNKKDKKRYFKIVEDYLENEFTDKLKKLSRKQGQILVKLINRQTGKTTFDLIKDYKSGWKAFWSNNTARVFDINLKKKYDPLTENEDYLIETILQRAFLDGRLINQKGVLEYNILELDDIWRSKN